MLIRLFSSIRQKPKQIRDQYAFWIAASVATLVAGFWFLGSSTQLLPDQVMSDSSETVFSSFFSEAGERLSEATESIPDIQEQPPTEQTAEIQMPDIEVVATTTASSSQVQAPTSRTIRIATTTSAAQ